MKRLFLILMFFMTTLSYCPPKLEKQPSSLEKIERNYNKLASLSIGLLITSAALNHEKIYNFLNSSFRPYLNQQNLGKGSLAMGLLFAVPLVYFEFYNEKGK